MQITVHAIERIGPVNLGAGNTDYIYKVFGIGRDESGAKIEVTCSSNKGEWEGMAEALLHHKAATYTARKDNVIAVQRTPRQPDQDETNAAIEKVRARSVRQS